MRISRRDFLKAAGLAVGAGLWQGCAAGPAAAKRPDTRPNIIYILADDLGYGDLGCYGQQRIQTPNLDRMAAEGMRFTQHYAGSTVCAPSRCVLMTGLHVGHARVRGNAHVPLRPEDVTAAEILKTSGYATALVGKWGLGEAETTGVPNRQGFDYFFGYLNQTAAHNYYPEFLWENDWRIELPNQVTYAKPGKPGGVSTNKAVYSHDLFMDKALAYIEANQSRPFFLYLALTIPHANNEAKNKGMEVPDLGAYADTDWPEAQKGHAAMISRMDAGIGTILERLAALGIDEETVVLFSSDNGPHAEGGNDPDFNDSNGPLRGIKRALYEGGIRVPLIVRWPGTVTAGGESDHISGFQDVMPTCAALAGTTAPDGIDGISFLPTLLGKTGEQATHEYLYWEFYEQGGRQAVRKGNWKAVRQNVSKRPNGPIELYDLRTDIGETNDVAGAHPEIVRDMAAIMKRARTESEDFTF